MENKPIILRGHHLSAVMEEYYNPGLMTDESAIKEYGERNITETRRLIFLILNTDVNITIVDGLDDMCKNCLSLNKGKDCTGSHMSKYDREVVSKYGLEIGKTYTSGEILSRIKKIFGDDLER